jgi:hypothetical protein
MASGKDKDSERSYNPDWYLGLEINEAQVGKYGALCETAGLFTLLSRLDVQLLA